MDPKDFADATDRLARTVTARVAQTGEMFEAASVAVLTDWMSEWPTVATACFRFVRGVA